MSAERDVQKELQNLKDDMSKLRADLVDMTSALTRLGKERIGDAAESLGDRVLDNKKVRRTLADMRGRSRKALRRLEDEFQERPYVGLLAAFGVGFVLAKLLRRD